MRSQQCKMAAAISSIFWLYFCTAGGRGDRSSNLICSPRSGQNIHIAMYWSMELKSNITKTLQSSTVQQNKNTAEPLWIVKLKKTLETAKWKMHQNVNYIISTVGVISINVSPSNNVQNKNTFTLVWCEKSRIPLTCWLFADSLWWDWFNVVFCWYFLERVFLFLF